MGVVSLRDPNGKAVFNPTAYEIWFDEGDIFIALKSGKLWKLNSAEICDNRPMWVFVENKLNKWKKSKREG